MKIKFLAPLIAFILLCVLLGIGLTLNPQHIPSTRIDKPAPAFALPELYTPATQFAPEQLLGQKWILNVWASWCVSCRAEHPLFNQIATKTDITLVGLNYKDKSDEAVQWLAERGNPYDFIPTDLKGDVGIDWGVYGVPETFVIDEQGIVIYKHTGPVDIQAVEQEILPLFN
jgi:cytochrome c biogenesis protein CcmG/thiol:disulfide interchange protein DsbE